MKRRIGHTKKRYRRNRKNVKGGDKVFRKQTLDRHAPRKPVLGPSSPSKITFIQLQPILFLPKLSVLNSDRNIKKIIIN
jgi:hypothetical protein